MEQADGTGAAGDSTGDKRTHERTPNHESRSVFGTQLAFALASQTPFLGFDAGRKNYKTLILQAEVNEKRMKDRFQKQVSGFPEASRDQVMSASVFSQVKSESHRAGQGPASLLRNSQRL